MWKNQTPGSGKDVPVCSRPTFVRPVRLLDKSKLKVVEKITRRYTAEEQYRIFGRIEGELAEELLDEHFQIEALDGMEATVKEARGCYPGEDVLTSQINDLNALIKSVRGDNKGKLERIVEELIEVRRELYDNAEHGRDELDKVIKALEM